MATIKTKDSKGQWVDVAVVENTDITMGDLRMAVIEATDAYTYDLSPYVEPDSNFLFFFKSTTNSTVPQSGGEMYVLEKIGETARKASWNSNTNSMGWWTSAIDVVLEDLFPNNWKFEGTWDNDARILTFPTTGASTYGILLYTGIKEA